MNFKKAIPIAIPAAIIIVAFIITVTLRENENGRNLKVEKNTSKKTNEPLYRCYPIMGTWAEISLYGDKKKSKKAADAIYDVFKRVNAVCSRFDKNSELSKLNKTAKKNPFKCSDMLWDILSKSRHFYDLSHGAFDVTITPLMKLWGFYRKQDKIPSDKQIKEALSKVGLNKVKFDEHNHSVYFTKHEMKIDLGGIAKGYAVDLAYEAANKNGVKAGIINLGGNIRCYSNPPPGKKDYVIGIRDPFEKDKIMKGAIKIKGQSLSTSGNYEQYVIIGGERFTHIINPKTGYPIKDMAAATVLCKSAIWADALSTSVFLNGEKFAKEIHEKFPGIDILVVTGYKENPNSIKIFKFGKIWDQISETLVSSKANRITI